VQSKEIIETLKRKANRNFLTENFEEDPRKLALNKSLSQDFPVQILSQILHLYHKAKRKLPTWVDNFWALTPKTYEQSSSEKAALFKSTIIKGNRLLNLTGGLGVDDYYFAKSFKNVVSYDIDPEIHALAKGNFEELTFNNATGKSVASIERRLGSAEQALDEALDNEYDLVYVDPDRRVEGGKRTFFLEHTQPNLLEIKDSILKRSPHLLIKASPMLDIKRAVEQLGNVTQVWVVSIRNEVKELLFHLERDKNENQEARITAVELHGEPASYCKANASEQSAILANDEIKYSYFFEFNAGLIKARLTNDFALEHDLKIAYQHGAYAYAESAIGSPFFKTYELISKLSFNKKQIRKYLQSHGLLKANVAKRNFPMEVKELRSLLKLKDGGDDSLFFYTDHSNKKWMVHAKQMVI